MDEPVLSMVKVPCDPAQVIVNHASFRVRLATPPPVSIVVPEAVGGSGPVPAGVSPARRRPLVWSGQSAPGDRAAGSLLQAVREAGGPGAPGEGLATEVLPRVPAGARPVRRTGTVVAPRAPHLGETTTPLPPVPDVPADEGVPGGPVVPGGRVPPRGRRPLEPDETGEWDTGEWETGEFETVPEGEPAPRVARGRGRGRRARAFHSDRRMSLGLVLLPLRLLLGFMAIYAGMGKLTDPVYFDGGDRGSLRTWLASMEPWAVAAPLHDWAVAHPVGAGLTVAFCQIVVGVLTLFGLWQRAAALLGAALSLALLTTVSWQHGPAYDTPEIVLFAAWTPLVIAGAPVHSLDARLAGEAWRRLGPRAPLSALRRRVLRRGALLASLLLGVALLVGSLLGSAVRSAQFATVPEPGEPPRNHLPGESLIDEEEEARLEREREAAAEAERREEAEREAADAEREAAEAEEREESAPGGTAPSEPAPDAGSRAPESEAPSEAPQDSAPAAPPASPEDGTGDPGTGGGAEEPAPDPGDGQDDGGDQGSPDPLGGLLG
ncbi:DoxX protein [Streptomyces zhaozhouensis]|uniref:DoxX protein n=1 Tax=Streptomyces zhaozhouensis TaxID=1300267 RepID=A0A286E1I5_9ACTN|nr:DoxX family membrane protein [Streptomyces zhaozhouensis]SOD64750.1 DoxX protein [Streptomyces zhaozhouensis]